MELTALIAFQNMSSKFNAALAIPAQGFCALPQAPPAAEGNRDGSGAESGGKPRRGEAGPA